MSMCFKRWACCYCNNVGIPQPGLTGAQDWQRCPRMWRCVNNVRPGFHRLGWRCSQGPRLAAPLLRELPEMRGVMKLLMPIFPTMSIPFSQVVSSILDYMLMTSLTSIAPSLEPISPWFPPFFSDLKFWYTVTP